MSDKPVLLPASVICRPEKRHRRTNKVADIIHAMLGWKRHLPDMTSSRYQKMVFSIRHEGERLSLMTDADLEQFTHDMKVTLRHEGLNNETVITCFALVREAASRILGMSHFDSQLIGGLALYFGNVAEMQTGEGKSLMATLPASAAALAGIPVHIVTVNDYLAARDAGLMGPLYEMLGLSVGCIVHDMTPDQRRSVYARDIVYCTNKELVFDYLKDCLALKGCEKTLQLHGARIIGKEPRESRLLLRGLHYGIVDEADSVLLDEACNPLVISGSQDISEEQGNVYRQALNTARLMEENSHFTLDFKQRHAELLEAGETFIAEHTCGMGNSWLGRIRRNELIQKALSAIHFFQKNHHYIVVDGKVQIVDEHTGRVMQDRSWEQGLHQMIEAKENCQLTSPRETLAKISYQRFFGKYHHLAGMTGTAKEVTGELWRIYSLAVFSVPLHQPSRRRHLPARVFSDKKAKWTAVVRRVQELQNRGRSILVGTVSVGESEVLSQLLHKAGIEHALLNARNDKEEADIVALAGLSRKVTIATNMAGRGTDIKLSKETRELGGLHVILTEYHDASRIDRQLEGRCARQGDPGSFEAFVSLGDSLLKNDRGQESGNGLELSGAPRRRGLVKLKNAQKSREKLYVRRRKDVFLQDEQRGDLLAFSNSHF